MKVSVIVAAYNIEDYIQRCLESISFQTLKDIEIIVVNDGSVDSTLEIINNIANGDKRVKIINKENKGLIEARKSGLKIASGEYILFVDGDDWIEKETLELLYENAVKNQSDIVMYNYYVSGEKSKIEESVLNEKLTNNDYLENLFLNKIKPTIWSKFIRLKFIKENNIELPSDISFAEDLATVATFFMNNPKVSILNKYLYNYCIRGTSLTNSINKNVLELNKAFNFIKEKLIEKRLYSYYKESFYYMIYLHMFEVWFNKYCDVSDINESLYKQYINTGIDINNKYIRKHINKYSFMPKLRINLYHKYYKFGRVFDRLVSIKSNIF